MHPPSAPRMEAAGIDGGVLAYSLLVSLVIGVLFGLAPAIEAARVDVNNGLRWSGEVPAAGLWPAAFHAGDD